MKFFIKINKNYEIFIKTQNFPKIHQNPKGNSMKRAFTLLELIFVIVILGVLAAIALPRLGASKDEAEITKALSNLKTLISDVRTYTLKNGELANTAVMSRVSGLESVDAAAAGVVSADFAVSNDNACLNVLFINADHISALAIVSNDTVKGFAEQIANIYNERAKNGDSDALRLSLSNAQKALIEADFTNENTTNKACKNLTTNENFKKMAASVEVVLGD